MSVVGHRADEAEDRRRSAGMIIHSRGMTKGRGQLEEVFGLEAAFAGFASISIRLASTVPFGETPRLLFSHTRPFGSRPHCVRRTVGSRATVLHRW